MSSSSGKRRGPSNGENIPEKLAKLFPRVDQSTFDESHFNQESVDNFADDRAQLPLQSRYGNAAIAHTLIQRKAEGEEVSEGPSTASETHLGAGTAQTVAISLIVDDTVAPVVP